MHNSFLRMFPICLLVIFGCCGCGSVEIRHNTLAQDQSLSTLEYQMVLDNLAMFKVNTGALPWQVKFTVGGTTIQNTVTPTFNYTWPTNFVRMLGVQAALQQQYSWTAVPLLTQKALMKLQAIYATNIKNDTWLNVGHPPPGSVAGSFGEEVVWVAPNHLGDLTNLVFQVLAVQDQADKEAAANGGTPKPVISVPVGPANTLQ